MKLERKKRGPKASDSLAGDVSPFHIGQAPFIYNAAMLNAQRGYSRTIPFRQETAIESPVALFRRSSTAMSEAGKVASGQPRELFGEKGGVPQHIEKDPYHTIEDRYIIQHVENVIAAALGEPQRQDHEGAYVRDRCDSP